MKSDQGSVQLVFVFINTHQVENRQTQNIIKAKMMNGLYRRRFVFLTKKESEQRRPELNWSVRDLEQEVLIRGQQLDLRPRRRAALRSPAEKYRGGQQVTHSGLVNLKLNVKQTMVLLNSFNNVVQ